MANHNREQDRIGTAARDCSLDRAITPQGDVRLAVRVGCSRQRANCCPRGMAVTYRLPQAGGALRNPAYRPADVLTNEGVRRDNAGPSPILRPIFTGWQTNAMTSEWHRCHDIFCHGRITRGPWKRSSRRIFDCSSTKSIKHLPWRRRSSAIIAIVDTTVTWTPRRCTA